MNADTTTMKIANPFTGRQNKFTVLTTTTDDAVAALKQGGIKAVSWMILSQGNVGARNTFENALDWTVGLIVVDFISQLTKMGKKAKVIRVAVASNGTVLIVRKDGEILLARQ
jgi:hypothetical protein